MKNRLALLLTILMVSGLWSFAQVAPAPQPKPQPDPQPQPQPTPTIELAPPPEGGEIRIDDGGNDFIRRGQYDRALQQKLGTRQQDLGTRQQDLGTRQQDLAGARQQDLAAREAFAYKQKTEKGSYIGLVTSPIPTVVRDQLKLPNGSGLVVDRVEPNSPAETAGMKVSDIIQKLDEQVLINPHQFGVLVRNLKPDAEVKLSIIRQTQPQTVSIKPEEKDLAPLDETAGFGPAVAWRDTQLANNTRYGGGGGTFTLTANPKKEKGNPYADVFNGIDRTEIVTDNGNTKITTTLDNKGDRRAAVVDKATGKVIFDGPIQTDEQRQALPKEVQDQLKQLDQMKLTAPMGIRVLPTPTKIWANGANVRVTGAQNNLPKPKSVSGSDDDYTWEFTTKTDENGKPELELLLLDKNGKILFQGPFSRTRNIKDLPAPVAERLGSYPWSMMIDDLKSTGGGAGINNAKIAPAIPEAPGAAPAAGNDFAPAPKRPAK